MADQFTVRSNIFGVTTSGSGASSIPYSSSQTTEAGKLIDKLKNIADNQIQNVAAGVNWLGTVANAGQNGSDRNSLVAYQNVKPDAITSSNVFKDWTPFALPTLPAFPTLPAALDINMGTFKGDVAALVNDLQNSWMAKFLPTTTDTSRYDTLMKDILNGSDDATNTAKLNTIYNELNSAITSMKTTAYSDVVAQVAALKTAVAASSSGLQPKIDSAIATAQDNTANIVWARARTQAAREAARQEAEATAEFAARGFSLPGGVLLAAQSMARQATLDAASKVAGEEAYRIQIMNVDLAKVAIDSWLRSSDFELRSNLDSMRTILEARMRYSSFELDADRSRAEQAVKNLGLRLDFTKFGAEFALKYRTEAIQGMNGLINAYANLNRSEMEYYSMIANAQRQNLQALIEYYRLSIAQAEIGIKVSSTNVENDIKWAQTAGDFIGRAVANHVQAAQSAANLYAQIAGQALSGLNGIAQVTSSG